MSKNAKGENLAVIDVDPPTASGDRIDTTMPLTWNSGRMSRQRSVAPSPVASMMPVTMAIRLAWSSSTPLGVPVVPLV